MITYTRKVRTELILLRAFFCSAMGLAYYLFRTGYEDYSFILSFLLCCGSVFPVTGLQLTANILIIRQYYFYGLLCRSFTFRSDDDVEIVPFDLEISDAGYLSTDDWWDFFTTLSPLSRTSIGKFVIKKTDMLGNKVQIKTKLNNKELGMVQEVFGRTSNTPDVSLVQ